jgi:hypothetical protein
MPPEYSGGLGGEVVHFLSPQKTGLAKIREGVINLEFVKLLPLPHPPRARPYGRTDKSKRPESRPTKECARARVLCLNTEPNYYYCPITLVMS